MDILIKIITTIVSIIFKIIMAILSAIFSCITSSSYNQNKQDRSIISAYQYSSSVTWVDVLYGNNKRGFTVPGILQGFTGQTVTVRQGKQIVTYNIDQRIINTRCV